MTSAGASSPPSSALSPANLAEARSRAYSLFSAVAVDGATAAIMPQLEAVPDLAAAVRVAIRAALEGTDPSSAADAAAALHFETLHHEIFPLQSVFLASDAQPGGPETDRLLATYRSVGFNVGERSPDHVGMLLDALAWTCGAEADAQVDGRGALVTRIRAMQCTLLDAHLLSWWPALAEAIAWHGEAMYVRWADAVTELVVHHRAELFTENGPDLGQDGAPAAERLGCLSEIVADNETGLSEIVAFLLTPARAGFFLGRRGIRSLGRDSRLPAGFGSRRTVLLNLMRSAGTYDAWATVIQRIETRCSAALSFYRRYVQQHDQAPGAVASARTWIEKCEDTRRGLATLRAIESERRS